MSDAWQLEDIRAYFWAQTRVKGSGCLPLLPRHKIALAAPHGDGARFAESFRRAWARIPIGFRRTMLRHWRGSAPESTGLIIAPAIELASDWSGRERGTIGMCSARGHMLRFWSRRVDLTPDALVQDLVAHELAHVWQWATAPEDFGAGDNFGIEEWADELMALWGFDPVAMDAWSISQGFTKVWTDDDLAKLSPSQRKRLRAKARRSGRGVGLLV